MSESKTELLPESQLLFVADVAATGTQLAAASNFIQCLIPRMWAGTLADRDTLMVATELTKALRDALQNAEIMEEYLREWVKGK